MLRNLPRVRAAAGALGAVVGYGCGLLAEHRAETKASSAERHSIVVIGGGAAGLSVASQLLLKLGTTADVAIVEPSEWHYYQPGWTLVGGGIMKAEETRKKMSSFMPKGATWIKAAVSAIDPDQNCARARVRAPNARARASGSRVLVVRLSACARVAQRSRLRTAGRWATTSWSSRPGCRSTFAA